MLPHCLLLLASLQSPEGRTIAAGEVHSYRQEVSKGQFVHVTAHQASSDVSIRLVLPDGTRYAGVDRLPYDAYEDLPWVASADGEIRVEIRAKRGGLYRYEIAVREASDKDRALAASFHLSWVEAEAVRAKPSAATLRAALSKYEEAETAARQAGAARWEAFALSQQAEVLNGLGQFTRALELLERSLPLRRSMDERYSLSVTLNGMGRMLVALGRPEQAHPHYQEALALRRAAGDQSGEAVVLTNLGGLHKRTSEFSLAAGYLRQALVIRRELGDANGESVTLAGLGDVHYVAGEYQAALDCYLQVWKLREGTGNQRAQANAAHYLGFTYYALGDTARAQQYWNIAEPAYREMGDVSSLAGVLYARGVARARGGELVSAQRTLEEALALHRQIKLANATVNDLNALCGVLVESGDAERAAALSTEALSMSREGKYRSGEGSALFCLGRAADRLKDYDRAHTLLSEALQVHRATRDRDNTASALILLARVAGTRGRLVEGLRYVEEAGELVELGRSQLLDPALRATFRAAQSDRVQLHTELLMALHQQQPQAGYGERAFNAAERSRARSLAEMIQSSREKLREELTAEQRQAEDRLLGATSALQRELFREGVTQARQQELKQQLSAAERDFDRFQQELRSAGSHYAASQYAEVLEAATIRDRLLDARSVLVTFALGDARSFAWALTTDRLTSVELPPRKEIEAQVDRWRQAIQKPVSALTVNTSLARADEEGRRLYRMLLAPLDAALERKTRILIVPDGRLAYLPFDALPGTVRLLERGSVSYVPSASTLAVLMERGKQRAAPERALLAFADSTPSPRAAQERAMAFTSLPNARTEVAGIGGLFQRAASRIYLGPEAGEPALRAEALDRYRYLHFAVHGYFDEAQPQRSGLVLSPGPDPGSDGVLQSPEIMRLHLNADVVTLSACQTGLGRLLAGEGVMGLSRAFLYAGAQSLVVSLWNVNDAATAELMKRFYANLKAGQRRDEALRSAKLALMRTPNSPWRHPYYWAAFVLLGEGGR